MLTCGRVRTPRIGDAAVIGVSGKTVDSTFGKERAKRWAQLASAKGRREQGLILLDSLGLVREALALGLVRELAHREGEHEDAAAAFRAAGGRPLAAEAHLLAKAADVETSPGIVAIADPPRPASPLLFDHTSWCAVYLDRVADPGNVGTIARSAAAFGADVLVLSEGCADPFSPKALRASAGALLRLPVHRADWTGETPGALRHATIFRATARAGADPMAVEWPARRILWFGNEAHGAATPHPAWRVTDVTIPMAAGTESLNVAAAAAVLLFAQRARVS
jgi:RNA methyltransferase, TrmH family